MNTYTIFTTYALVTTGSTFGLTYTRGIHCNYIKKTQITTSDISIHEINFNFPNLNDFKFLNDDINDGTGFFAHKIYILLQVVNSGDTEISLVEPIPSEWRYLDVTNQIQNNAGQYLNGNKLVSQVFKIPLNNYYNYNIYDINYLTYPSLNATNAFSFGDETYLLGNVDTEIKADVYTTDLTINLPLNEFNSSNNLTWDGTSSVYISEIGIFDENKNLVAIGKLNNPISKDSTISRTILFSMDF